MKKILYTTTAFILFGLAQSQAACIATPSCTTLGYTETSSCDGGLKCPFGNYWNCTHINKITELTNKITELEKVIETSQSQGEVCIIGSILYSDKSCYLNPQKGKTPIGVVVYVDGKGGGQALALNSLDTKYYWDVEEYNDIQELRNYVTASGASKDYASCENSKIIMAAGDKSKYPAVWATNEYKTGGTKAGDWCLPAAGIFYSYQNNQTSVNLGFDRVNGTKFTTSTRAWSSSEGDYDGYTAWLANFGKSYGSQGEAKTFKEEVRPVIEF